MEVRIYQINLERDEEAIAFCSLEMLENYGKKLSLKIYDVVFHGEINARDLEEIFVVCNGDRRPEGYTGRSMAVADVVEIIKSEDVEPGYYFCDSIGFKKVAFWLGEKQEPQCSTCKYAFKEQWAKNKTALRCRHDSEDKHYDYVVAQIKENEADIPITAPMWCGRRKHE